MVKSNPTPLLPPPPPYVPIHVCRVGYCRQIMIPMYYIPKYSKLVQGLYILLEN